MTTEEVKPEVKEVHIPPDISKADLERHRGEIQAEIKQLRDELAELHTGDKTEREELKAQIAKHEEVIEAYRKAEEEREKVKGSSSTMVLPPNDIAPQQPNTPPATGGDAKPGETPKRRLRGW